MPSATPEGIYETGPFEDAGNPGKEPALKGFGHMRKKPPAELPLEDGSLEDGPSTDAADANVEQLPALPAPAPASACAAPSESPASQTASAAAARQAANRVNTGTVAVVVCLVILVALTMLGGMLNVGDHLMAAHPVLGWVFYAILVALVVVGVIVPTVKIAKRPIFSLYQLRDETGKAKKRRCRMLADNLIENTELSEEDIQELERILQAGDETDDLLIEFFKKHCIPMIDTETKRAASTAFFISAVSRSPLISTVTMLSVCLDLVRAIVEVCGFRPTNLGLARLYTRVMLSALIIGGIEDSDLSDLLGQVMGGGAGARAGGIVLGATAEGLVSAFLVFRVGVLTKKWLTAEDGPVSMRSIRRTSYREALALMRTSEFMQTVSDTVKQTTGAVATGVANTVKHTTETVAANVAHSVKTTTDSMASSVSEMFSHAAQSTRDAAKSLFNHE